MENEPNKSKYEKPGFVTTKDLCDYYSICQRTLQRWRNEGLPHQVMSPRTIRYDFDAVEDWVSKRRLKLEREKELKMDAKRLKEA